MTDIIDQLLAPFGRLTRAMRADAACEIEALRAENAKLTELLAEESKEVVRLQCAALTLTGKNTTLHQMLRHIQSVDPEWVTYISAAMGESDE